jgi:hypothetical protein
MLVGSGCATKALWDNASGGDWRPNTAEHVCLFTTRLDPSTNVAVFFDQSYFGRTFDKPRPALWCFGQSATNLFTDANAIRACTNSWVKVQTVPVFQEVCDVPPNRTKVPPGYAVLGASRGQFTLQVAGIPPGPYTLPVTHVKGSPAALWIGTPFAVAIDGAIVVGAVCSFFCDAGLIQ